MIRSQELKVKVTVSELAFFNFIFEGYDHLASLTVLDAKQGIVKLNFYPSEESLIQEILQDLKASQGISLEVI